MPTFDEVKQKKQELRKHLQSLLASNSNPIHQHLSVFLESGRAGLNAYLNENHIEFKEATNRQTGAEYQEYVITVNGTPYHVLFNEQNLWIASNKTSDDEFTNYFSFVRRKGGKGDDKKWRLEVLHYDRAALAGEGGFGEFTRGLGVIVAEDPSVEAAPSQTSETDTESSRVIEIGKDKPLYLKTSTRQGNSRGNKNFKPTYVKQCSKKKSDDKDSERSDAAPIDIEQQEADKDASESSSHPHLRLKPVADGAGQTFTYRDPQGHYNILGRDLGMVLNPREIATSGKHFDIAIALLEAYMEQVSDEKVHGDIKINNILINDAGIVSLIDYGLAVNINSSIHPRGTPGHNLSETTFACHDNGKIIARKKYNSSKSQDHYALGLMLNALFGAERQMIIIDCMTLLNGGDFTKSKDLRKAELFWHEDGRPMFANGLFSNVYDLTEGEQSEISKTLQKLNDVTLSSPANIAGIIRELNDQREQWNDRKSLNPGDHNALVKKNIIDKLNTYSAKFQQVKTFTYTMFGPLFVTNNTVRREQKLLEIQETIAEYNDNNSSVTNEELLLLAQDCQDIFINCQYGQFNWLGKQINAYREIIGTEPNDDFDQAVEVIKQAAYKNGYVQCDKVNQFLQAAEQACFAKLQAEYTAELEKFNGLQLPASFKNEFDAIKAALMDAMKPQAELEREAKLLPQYPSFVIRKEQFQKIVADYRANIAFVKETHDLIHAASNPQRQPAENNEDGGQATKSFEDQLRDYTAKRQDHHLRKKVAVCAINIALWTIVGTVGIGIAAALLMSGPIGWAFTGLVATSFGLGAVGGGSAAGISTAAICSFWQKPVENRIIDHAKTIQKTPLQAPGAS
ncbi:MAG: hypothetical protein CMF50_00640 [Legionellales bacterium]|nr:hypothetical protein [Legionellales bacterium]|tara:strand:- start:18566 stop:21124 length:2559 start_codon:yes stop_codon:yes gene_type:complete